MSVMRCHWCSQFLSKDKAKATLREPETFYCASCFQKGVEMENEAMGLYDEPYLTREQILGIDDERVQTGLNQ